MCTPYRLALCIENRLKTATVGGVNTSLNMELHTIRGGTKEELEAKKYNIGIGLSLGNKWFTPENIVQQIKWALPYTREYVVVYVADTIHAINLEVRSRMTKERALRVAKRYGQEILAAVRDEADRVFSTEERKKILYATWDDVATQEYKDNVQYLYGLYGSNVVFHEQIREVVRCWVEKDSRIFTDTEQEQLGTYILEELPEVMARVPIGGHVYDAYAYPHDGRLTQFIEKLQKGELSPEVRERIMHSLPKVFLEVR
jgi:tRNA-dependent cyclodipeptide synthase